MVSHTLWLTLNQFSSNPRSPRWFHFFFKLGKLDTQWVEENKVNPSRPLSFSGACFSLLSGDFSRAVQIWVRGTFGILISTVILVDLDFTVVHTIYMSTRVCRKFLYAYVIVQFIQYNMKCRPMCAFPQGTQPWFLPCGKHINLEFPCRA